MNHDIMNCTADGVIGNHLYSGRALGLSEPWDIIQLHPDLKPLWQDINDHYNRIGLSHSENVIWNLDLRHLGMHIGYQPSVFYFGPNECKYWGDHEWLETVEYINSKNNFMTLARELGVDVPRTLCFDTVADIGVDAMQEIVYPCYLKAAVSVSGVGICRCENKAEFYEALSKFAEDVPVQVQEEVKTETFLNMQYRVSGNDVIRLATSEQILDGFVHQGNRVPASHEPWEAVDAMAYWLKDHGMKGIFAFDVAVVQTERGLRFPAIECNPRFNGASYPTMIAEKLHILAWSAITLSTEDRTLADIDLSDIEFDRMSGEGVIIVNWGTVLEGKLVVLLAGSQTLQQTLAVELAARL
ncbi:MAG: ATP-grasp domain-containing protein [Halobacteria archaeon]|nr:ATP-grasp domain-containing protein [Halobacteria archaeon]